METTTESTNRLPEWLDNLICIGMLTLIFGLIIICLLLYMQCGELKNGIAEMEKEYKVQIANYQNKVDECRKINLIMNGEEEPKKKKKRWLGF